MKTNSSVQKPWADCPPNGRLLRPKEVFDRSGLSRSQVYSMIAEGDFPPFLKVSTRAAAMPEAWLQSFIQDRAKVALESAAKLTTKHEHASSGEGCCPAMGRKK